MKKVNFKSFLTTLFVLLAVCFAGVEAQSQSLLSATAANNGSVKSLYVAPQGDFVDDAEARDILRQALIDIKVEGNGATAPQQALLVNKFSYYEAILVNLEGSDDVAESIQAGLEVLNPDANGVSVAQLLDLRQGAIDLLSI